MIKFLSTASVAALMLFAPLPSSDVNPFAITRAHAQSAVVVDKITIEAGGVTATIPTLTVEGSSATAADIRAMFDPKAVDQLAKRFAAFSAKSVTIPMIEIKQKLGNGEVSTTRYQNTVMREISKGIIAEIVTAQMTSTSDVKTGDKSKTNITSNSVDMVMKGLNVVLMARFLTDKAEPGEQLQSALTEQTIGKTTLKSDQFEMTIDRITMSDLKLKPLKEPLKQTLETLESNKIGATKSAETARDFFSSMSIANVEATGIKGQFPDTGKKKVNFGLGSLRFAGGGDVKAGFGMKGMTFESPDGKMNIGEMSLNGIKYPIFSAAASGSTGTYKTEDFFPTFEHFRFAGLDVDVPPSGKNTKRTQVKLNEFDLKMGNHIGFIPTNVALLLDRIQMDIPSDTTEKSLKDILALGYKSLDVSMKYDQAFDEANKNLKLNELSINSVGMFEATAKAELTNVAKEIFTTDKAVASVAAISIMAKSVSVAVKNNSLFEKLIAQQAKDQKRKPEDLRAELAAGATMMIPLFLGEHPGAQALGAAIGKFLADPKNLKVDITAKGAGVGAVDFLATKNPIDILKKVDITASSNQ
jgi:hypothetical protein